MSKKYDTIYLDWDGVLWNFIQAYCDWYCFDIPDTDTWEFYDSLAMTEDEFLQSLSELPQEFWQQEKYLMPHAHKLVEWAKANADNVFVLTVAPEWACWLGKQNLAGIHFGLTVYTVAKAEEKTEFAKKGCLLIDDKDSSVIRFAREVSGAGGGYVWPANYNQGLDHSWYFKLSWLEKVEMPTVDSKPLLDYDAMDEAKRRKMTPMYSGRLAYFPDALALVARNSVIGQHQHGTLEEPLQWDRTKSADEMDAMIRHMADHSKDPYDKDGVLHMSKVAWRALAFVQKFIDTEGEDNGWTI